MARGARARFALLTSNSALAMLVDSHCHLTDAKFDEDRRDVLFRAREAGVERILTVASSREDAEAVVELVKEATRGRPATQGQEGPRSSPPESSAPESSAPETSAPETSAPESSPPESSAPEPSPPGERSPGEEGVLPALWGTAGIHPHEAEAAREGDLDAIREMIRDQTRLVAVGETGLDFYYDNSPRDVQEALFRQHMSLAEELNLPIVVHSRSADGATARILKEWGTRVRGVLHCYTGGPELMHAALDLGWMISLTGIITFRRYDARALVRDVPRDRLMVETDAPYLAPVPHRGRRNEPAYVARVAQSLATIREEDLEEVLGYTTANAVRFFDLTP